MNAGELVYRMRNAVNKATAICALLESQLPPPIDPERPHIGLHTDLRTTRKYFEDLVKEFDDLYEIRPDPPVQPVSIPVGQDTLREMGENAGDREVSGGRGQHVPLSQDSDMGRQRTSEENQSGGGTAVRRCSYFSCPHTPTCLESAVPFGPS